ncbi:translation initiation factor IF-2-like isoform X2 [Pyrgilauda ruficollis]|uniref:translation initiation factor IF-2-like isoform X2 n=1 Tax=Pyrgilauda ruficollis TaxID=221976 RepID=UPI001B8802D0|nr:translation initiation factor IF-2-like isoform X2 [Pyrgilauda ruficollis]XP_041339466.1 translation initiation factor IF-2-like isoform X2 [Pyrgilauda ruficollis]
MVKVVVFHYFFWVVLVVVFITGTNRISLFGLGYVLACFYLLLSGTAMLRKPARARLVLWDCLILYNIAVIISKNMLSLLSCVFVQQMQSRFCWVIQLFSLVCTVKGYYNRDAQGPRLHAARGGGRHHLGQHLLLLPPAPAPHLPQLLLLARHVEPPSLCPAGFQGRGTVQGQHLEEPALAPASREEVAGPAEAADGADPSQAAEVPPGAGHQRGAGRSQSSSRRPGRPVPAEGAVVAAMVRPRRSAAFRGILPLRVGQRGGGRGAGGATAGEAERLPARLPGLGDQHQDGAAAAGAARAAEATHHRQRCRAQQRLAAGSEHAEVPVAAVPGPGGRADPVAGQPNPGAHGHVAGPVPREICHGGAAGQGRGDKPGVPR